LIRQLRFVLSELPFLAHIESQKNYENVLAMMDDFIEDYNTNKPPLWIWPSRHFSGFVQRYYSLHMPSLLKLMSFHWGGICPS
jgi:hypothetical protein